MNSKTKSPLTYRILVTGGRGFIGSRLVEKLREAGHEVYTYDIVDNQDLLNLGQLEMAIGNVEVVFHVAAQADLTQMSQSPQAGRDGVMRNVEATHNVAYLCAKYDKWLIYASTLCVYGNQKSHPSTEDETLPNPSELYACSKYAGEWLVKGYGYNYGMRWTIQRYATIYGPGMRPALGMHIFLRQALQEQPITVHGDGEQVRTLTYIDDLVEGIMAPLQKPESAFSQVFNITADEEISANKMAKDIKTVTKTKSEITHIEQRANQTFKESVSNGKIKKLLGWKPKTKWSEGVAKTHEWIKSQLTLWLISPQNTYNDHLKKLIWLLV